MKCEQTILSGWSVTCVNSWRNSNSILFTAVVKPKIHFVWEIITDWAGETDLEVPSTKTLVLEFLEKLDILSIEKLGKLNYAPEVSVAMSNYIYVGKVL